MVDEKFWEWAHGPVLAKEANPEEIITAVTQRQWQREDALRIYNEGQEGCVDHAWQLLGDVNGMWIHPPQTADVRRKYKMVAKLSMVN